MDTAVAVQHQVLQHQLFTDKSQGEGQKAYFSRVFVEELGEGLAVGGPHATGAEVAGHLSQGPFQLYGQHHQARPLLQIECELQLIKPLMLLMTTQQPQ